MSLVQEEAEETEVARVKTRVKRLSRTREKNKVKINPEEAVEVVAVEVVAVVVVEDQEMMKAKLLVATREETMSHINKKFPSVMIRKIKTLEQEVKVREEVEDLEVVTETPREMMTTTAVKTLCWAA